MATKVEGDPRAPFLIATTPWCRGGHYSFHWIAPLYPWSLPYKQGGIRYHFLSLWYDSTWDWTQGSRAIGEHCQCPDIRSINIIIDLSYKSSCICICIYFLFLINDWIVMRVQYNRCQHRKWNQGNRFKRAETV